MFSCLLMYPENWEIFELPEAEVTSILKCLGLHSLVANLMQSSRSPSKQSCFKHSNFRLLQSTTIFLNFLNWSLFLIIIISKIISNHYFYQ